MTVHYTGRAQPKKSTTTLNRQDCPKWQPTLLCCCLKSHRELRAFAAPHSPGTHVEVTAMDQAPAEDTVTAQLAPAACRSVVVALMARGAWKSVGEDELVERVWRDAGPNASPGAFDRLVKYHYSAVLYAACCQQQDVRKREAAFEDLHRLLYRAAYSRWPELAEDAAQRALILVYEQLDRCREPGTFLAFALNKLRHGFQQERRSLKRGDVSPDDLDSVLADDEAANLEQNLLSQESTTALLQALERLVDPRQRSVVLWKYLGGLSDEDIAQRLGIMSGYVRVLRHRGMESLRADEILQLCLSGESQRPSG